MDHILTPSQLNTLARDLLEGAFPLVLVEGEIGNLSRPGSGHLYFTLKDARAQVVGRRQRDRRNFVRRERTAAGDAEHQSREAERTQDEVGLEVDALHRCVR